MVSNKSWQGKLEEALRNTHSGTTLEMYEFHREPTLRAARAARATRGGIPLDMAYHATWLQDGDQRGCVPKDAPYRLSGPRAQKHAAGTCPMVLEPNAVLKVALW